MSASKRNRYTNNERIALHVAVKTLRDLGWELNPETLFDSIERSGSLYLVRMVRWGCRDYSYLVEVLFDEKGRGIAIAKHWSNYLFMQNCCNEKTFITTFAITEIDQFVSPSVSFDQTYASPFIIMNEGDQTFWAKGLNQKKWAHDLKSAREVVERWETAYLLGKLLSDIEPPYVAEVGGYGWNVACIFGQFSIPTVNISGKTGAEDLAQKLNEIFLLVAKTE